MIRSWVGAVFVAALGLGAVVTEGAAQDFPKRPITLIIPWPAGGPTDIQMRPLAEAAGKILGQPITIENKPGASGTLGPATMAATAKPDGYTIAQMPITMFRLPYMQKVSFDPLKDFTYIIHVTGYVFGVAVRADSPWKTWKELLAYAKENPGKLRYASTGTGGTQHVTMEEIAKKHGIKWVHVPFRGAAESNAALLGSHVEVLAGGASAGPMVDSGEFRMLVLWTRERSPRFPNTPTLMEEGEGIVSESPYGIAGPKGMDPKVLKILHDAFKEAIDDPAHLKAVETMSQTLRYLDTASYEQFVKETVAKEQRLIQELGIKPAN